MVDNIGEQCNHEDEFLCFVFKGLDYLHMLMNDKVDVRVSSSITRLSKTKSKFAPKYSC